MPAPVLATKLYIPPPRPNIVPRPRLIERLNDGLAMGCRLTLISASAGFGKTTLVSNWITDCGRLVAWISLDEGDNDPIRFITYLIAALQTIKAGLGEGVLSTLQSHQPPQVEVRGPVGGQRTALAADAQFKDAGADDTAGAGASAADRVRAQVDLRDAAESPVELGHRRAGALQNKDLLRHREVSGRIERAGVSNGE